MISELAKLADTDRVAKIWEMCESGVPARLILVSILAMFLAARTEAARAERVRLAEKIRRRRSRLRGKKPTVVVLDELADDIAESA